MATVLRLVAIALSAVVALGFVLFAIDEMNRGSQGQQAAIARGSVPTTEVVVAPAPAPADESIRERQHGKVREAIDDANDELLAPFAGIVHSKSNWVTHGVPALLALLIYGVGLGALANFLPKATTSAGDWRTA
jgi:hypothetical protein